MKPQSERHGVAELMKHAGNACCVLSSAPRATTALPSAVCGEILVCSQQDRTSFSLPASSLHCELTHHNSAWIPCGLQYSCAAQFPSAHPQTLIRKGHHLVEGIVQQAGSEADSGSCGAGCECECQCDGSAVFRRLYDGNFCESAES